jgi:hypothetical protein
VAGFVNFPLRLTPACGSSAGHPTASMPISRRRFRGDARANASAGTFQCGMICDRSAGSPSPRPACGERSETKSPGEGDSPRTLHLWNLQKRPSPRPSKSELRSSPLPACGERSRASLRAGEGDSRQAQTRGQSPLTRRLRCAPSPTSPRKRGEVKVSALFANTASRSRRIIRASFAINLPPSEIRGRGECRAPGAPAAARVV